MAIRGGGSLTRLRDLVTFSIGLVASASRGPFAVLSALQLVGALLLVAQVVIVGWLLTAILSLQQNGPQTALLPISALALTTAVGALTGSLQTSLSRYVGESVSRTMWLSVLEVSTRVGLRDFEDPSFFDQLDRVRTQALSRPFLVTTGIVASLGALASVIGLGITLFLLNPWLLPLIVLGGVPVLLSGRMESRLEFRFAVAQTQPNRKRMYLSVVLTGRDEAKEVRAFGMAENLMGRFAEMYRRYLRDLRAHLVRTTQMNAVAQLAAAVVLGATLFAMVWLIGAGSLSVASAGAALVAVRLVAGQVQALAGGVQGIFESGLFIDDLRKFLARGQDQPPRIQGNPIEFSEVRAQNVSFTYPGRDLPAVRDATVRIGKGQVVALVGENGSGKSTLAKIVAGLYPVDSGAVLWNGTAEQDLPVGTAQASTAVIFQDFVRYAMDLRTNIALGRPNQPPDEVAVRRAAAAAGAGGFAEQLPNGYDTVLTRLFEGGHDLSGGQWQRVAIARAFYRDAPLVILDEPSAALDPRAEYDLFSSLRNTIEGRSALIISHRFSTVRNADRIYVMHDGSVAEEGDHDELMALDGIYAELFQLQAAAYLPDADPPLPENPDRAPTG